MAGRDPELAKPALRAFGDLLRGLEASGSVGEDPRHVHAGLITVLLRLVVMLYAEARGLMPGLGVARLFEQLHADPERFDAWPRLLALFRQLFDPDEYPFLERAHAISDLVVRRVLANLLVVDYRELDVEQLGSVYEALRSTEQRRRSGSHYTPRSLTEPIVRTTLRPLLEDLGEAPTPAQILDLKVCDPAMGSGAFLLEACRQLADALVAAWVKHGCVPSDIPPDVDRVMHARRLVAQRCLYGVDKDPFAVSLAKLSLWLETAASDQPFTFLDHALEHGDSLVGLTRRQIAAFHWKESKPIDSPPKDLCLAGDLVIAAFFSSERAKPRERRRAELLEKIEAWQASGEGGEHLRSLVAAMRTADRAIQPFHWELEFPEVFDRPNPGFDAIIGNPPFMGGRHVTASLGDRYAAWLVAKHPGSSGGADLVAHFFRVGFELLREGGTLGLIATNTIRQGDTRAAGLRWICEHGGHIYAVAKRRSWPGKAVVVVSVVHLRKRVAVRARTIDGREVETISAFLFHRGGHDDPAPLRENAKLSFQGAVVLGAGFVFEDGNPDATAIEEMHGILERSPATAERIFPYIGGHAINHEPRHRHHRYVIHLGEASESEARARWPELMHILDAKVRPERARKDPEKYPRMVNEWWKFWNSRPELEQAIAGLRRVIACAQTSKYRLFTFLPSALVYDQKVIVFAFESSAALAVLQSRSHTLWSDFFGSTMKDDPVYTPTDCFRTFPFPAGWSEQVALEQAGQRYHEFRAELMIRNDQGLTTTYNRFHDPDETAAEILELRELHDQLDRAVLDSYGWTDLRARCEFLLDYQLEDEEAGRRKQPWRYRWPDVVQDEVLGRLLALNCARADAERLGPEPRA